MENHDYLAKIQEEGFLLRKDTLDDFNQDFENIYFFDDESGNTLGYIRLVRYTEPSFQSESINIWINNAYKNDYFATDNHFEIRGCVVNQEYASSNILDEIFNVICEDLKSKGFKNLFASYTFAPAINTPNMLFFDKKGFEKICISAPRTLYGVNNFQAILCVKEL
jgi:hypothetical protein